MNEDLKTILNSPITYVFLTIIIFVVCKIFGVIK